MIFLHVLLNIWQEHRKKREFKKQHGKSALIVYMHGCHFPPFSPLFSLPFFSQRLII